MLHYYGQDEHYETVKEWYAGYRFGNADVGIVIEGKVCKKWERGSGVQGSSETDH